MRHPLILALDTALNACSGAVWKNGAALAWQSREMARGQAEEIVPMMERLLKRAGVTAAQLDLIAVTTGPGAFTGVRIGLSAARALSVSHGIPALGLTTLFVMAAEAALKEKFQGDLLMVLETKRRDVYAQLFHIHKDTPMAPVPHGPPLCAGPSDIKNLIKDAGQDALLLAGDATEKVLGWDPGIPNKTQIKVIDGITHPDPRILAACADAQWTAQDFSDPEPPQPLYLRPAEAKPAQPTDWGGDRERK